MRTLLRPALGGASILALAFAVPAYAQDPEAAQIRTEDSDDKDDSDDDLESADAIVVQGQIGYRNRSTSTEPKLIYDTDYFQRFEPLTIGDALKRVPSVSFLSDVIESDGARLRGLDPGYTQILINGEKVPGVNTDRTFFLDRIPAELVDRVEIVRSNSARRTSDAVAGTLNIVLRDAFELDGGYVKVGALRFRDDEIEPLLGAVWGGKVGPGRLLLGATMQGRHNPKQKLSLRYGDSPENNPDFATDDFDNREDQSDVRDGKDYSFNGSYGVDIGAATRLELSGFYTHTDRNEHERSFEYDDLTAETGPIGGGGNLLTDADQLEDIKQDNYSLAAKLRHEWSLGKTSLKVGYARFKDDTTSTEVGIDFDVDLDEGEGPEFEWDREIQKVKDSEFSAGLEHSFPVSPGVNLVVGAFYQDKDRRTNIRDSGDDEELDPAIQDSWDQFSDSPADLPFAFDEFEPIAGGFNRIEERRKDVFALVEGKTGIISWEAGARLENTKLKVNDLESDERFRNDYSILLPSASIKVDVTAHDRINASVARTNRRPNFDYISPAVLEEEVGDNDFRGRPDLKPEKAWGVDLGYEHRIGRTGVAGVNVFYRKITDLIEIVNTGEEGSANDPEECQEDSGTDVCFFIYEPRNIGNGKAWGVEFDLSTGLDFVGLPDTGIFGNLALLDSSVRDDLGKRRFNGQPKYVYNVGFIQNLRSVSAAFGVTYRKQGPAKDRVFAEEVRTTYGGDLEAFVEKRFGKRLTIRAVGSNLLNGAKKELFNKFDTLEDQIDRNFDEYEIESEKAGRVFQVVARLAF